MPVKEHKKGESPVSEQNKPEKGQNKPKKGYYTTSYYCTNCGSSGELTLEVGIPIETKECPNCGCAYLDSKYKEY
jgi:hypothetical protein